MTTKIQSGPIRVAVAQMTSGPDVDKNLEAVGRLVARAVDERARLLVLPECFAYLGPEAGKLALAEPLPGGGRILAHCAKLAREGKIELVLGGFWETGATPEKVRNACVHLDTEGVVRSVYRKIHLFDVSLADGTNLCESATVEPGSEPVVTHTPFGALGLSVCYDLRFPELYRKLVDLGAIALAIPAAFTLTTGKDHWHVLLRARAIESQSYVLAAAQIGLHFGTRTSYGHALVCDPWGVVVAEHGDGEGIAVAAIDPAMVARVRAQLPSLAHRRL